MKNLDQFLDEAQTTKCPKGFRFDTKLKSCVPKKRYPYYPYGMMGRRNEEPKKNGNGNGNGHSGNGNGSNGHSGGNGNGASGGNGGGNGGGGE
tara:strand:+ start:883 stop:1161 length:279 start_codon:yes stop_codon:yes gene_type:complete